MVDVVDLDELGLCVIGMIEVLLLLSLAAVCSVFSLEGDTSMVIVSSLFSPSVLTMLSLKGNSSMIIVSFLW